MEGGRNNGVRDAEWCMLCELEEHIRGTAALMETQHEQRKQYGTSALVRTGQCGAFILTVCTSAPLRAARPIG